MSECPFCRNDPFHRVDNGLGMVPVAVTCCELGIEYYRNTDAETVEIGRGDFDEMADNLRDARAAVNFCAGLETIPEGVTAGELVEAAQALVDAKAAEIDAILTQKADVISAAYCISNEAANALEDILSAFKDKSHER